tara:strand:+ start:491 stop:1207 length:717 start_codon:yes stop_codon:yes gene_type:complete
MSGENIIISKDTTKRLLSDVTDLIKNPLTQENIYYIHDDADMLKGYALIIGPDDCIYRGGAYFFEFNFPYDYPLRPPHVTYHTNDGNTRFNPNLYRNGKVCISILNTWKGEQWTSCQTIRSVLMTLVTLFHNEPITNEPGFTSKDKDAKGYHQIIEYKNYEVAIIGMLTQKYLPDKFLGFYSLYKDYFIKNKDKIKSDLEKKIKTKREIVAIDIYKMTTLIDYKNLNEIFVKSCYSIV